MCRWALALKTKSTALPRSAERSTYAWQTPIPPVTAGILAFSATMCTNSALPRGTKRSMQSSISSISPTSARSVDSTNCTASFGKPAATTAARTNDAKDELVRIASLPPRKMTAFPAFRHNAAMSIVTLGRLS